MSADLWTWDLEPTEGGSGPPMDLVVWSPDSEEVGRETRESWTWRNDYPNVVEDLMPATEAADRAIQRGWIERA